MMIMMVLVMLVPMLVMMMMVMIMVLVAVTMSGIMLRQELGRRLRNREWLAGHQGCRCWRQSSGAIGMSLPLLRVSGLLRQKLWRWGLHGEELSSHNHLLWRG